MQQTLSSFKLFLWEQLSLELLCVALLGIDVGTDPRAPRHSKVAEPDDVTKTGLAFLHTAHCLGSGDIMVC